MTYLYRLFLSLFFLTAGTYIAGAQRQKKADKAIISQLALHQDYLSAEDSARGEKRLMEYVCSEFKKNGITPKGNAGSYYCYFDISEGMESASQSFLFINGEKINTGDYIPLLMSPAVILEASPSLALPEAGQPWFLNLNEFLESAETSETVSPVQAKANGIPETLRAEPAMYVYILTKAGEAKQKGATALFLYSTSPHNSTPAYNIYEGKGALPLPIIYVQPAIARKYFEDETATLDIKLKVKFTEKKRKKQYIAGLINNNAPSTVIIGAGENSNNAAALIELGKLLKKSKQKNHNYLLVAFSNRNLPAPEIPSAVPLKVDYTINTGNMNNPDKLNYIYSILEKTK